MEYREIEIYTFFLFKTICTNVTTECWSTFSNKCSSENEWMVFLGINFRENNFYIYIINILSNRLYILSKNQLRLSRNEMLKMLFIWFSLAIRQFSVTCKSEANVIGRIMNWKQVPLQSAIHIMNHGNVRWLRRGLIHVARFMFPLQSLWGAISWIFY